MKKIKLFITSLSILFLCFCILWYVGSQQEDIVLTLSSQSTTLPLNAKANSALTIMLDPGHGGYDSGAITKNGDLEKDITLAIATKIGNILQNAGYQIRYTRQSDEVPWINSNLEDLQTRIAMASSQKADYFISIHTNFSAYDDGASGFESYLNYQNDTIITMASAIHEQLGKLAYTQDRGLKNTSETPLYVIEQNPIPALLIELGFLSDKQDASYLLNNQDALASAIAEGIMSTLP